MKQPSSITTASPWRFERWSHHRDAVAVETVPASELDADRFRNHFVEPLRPCVIEGAVREWPATRSWRSPEHLASRLASTQIVTRSSPRIDSERIADRATRYAREIAAQTAELETLPAETFVSRWMRGEGFRETILKFDNAAQRALLDELGRFSFLTESPAPVWYARHRAFVYASSYTDWHFHVTDETLMCQLAGDKETLLAPPEAFGSFCDILGRAPRVYELAAEEVDARCADHKWHRAVVRDGDALYIPPGWWHVVRPLDDRPGITLATCWRSPPSRARRFFALPSNVHLLRHHPLMAARMVALVGAGPLVDRLRPAR